MAKIAMEGKKHVLCKRRTNLTDWEVCGDLDIKNRNFTAFLKTRFVRRRSRPISIFKESEGDGERARPATFQRRNFK